MKKVQCSGRWAARPLLVIVLAWLSVLITDSLAFAQSQCIYVNEEGMVVAAPSIRDVPSRFRAKAACQHKQPQEIPHAEDVTLRGGERVSSFVTALGAMEVKWPRQIERCFSKSPSRAISEAASAVNRAIKTARFDSVVRTGRRDWSLLLIDRASAVSQFPLELSVGGHPGFAVPPNRIYIVVDYVSPGCVPSSEGDARLVQVLLHEMGHIIEFALLNHEDLHADRKRAEGFAAWFEGYSSKFASIIPERSVQSFYRSMITSQAGVGSAAFSGSGEDYALASLEFEAIVARKGISGLMDIYAVMNSERCSFYEALNRRFGWDQRTLAREVKNLKPS